jgi:radical SAM protein with 4Fe4S-binding SPASM domain
MSLTTALSIIYNEIEKTPNDVTLEFDLFGGEPFLEFETIKQIVKDVREKGVTHPYIFFAITNGTLVHGEIKEWLIENRDIFVCGLSYDGTDLMQNINRSNSASRIDLGFFRNHYKNQPIKMTVSKESLPYLAEGVEYLYEFGFDEVSCNLAYGIDWTDPNNENIFNAELEKLIDFFLIHPEYKPCSMLDMGIATCTPEDKMHRFCGSGINMAAYDIDGVSYPCQMFMPITVGKEKAEKSHSLKFYEDEIPLEVIDGKCRDCVVRLSCPTCYGANYRAFGDLYTHSDDYCFLTKKMMKARSYFKAKQWEKGQLKLSDEEAHALINDILIIQEKL